MRFWRANQRIRRDRDTTALRSIVRNVGLVRLRIPICYIFGSVCPLRGCFGIAALTADLLRPFFRPQIAVLARSSFLRAISICIVLFLSCLIQMHDSTAKTGLRQEDDVEAAVRCYVSLNYGCVIEKLAPLISSLPNQTDPTAQKKIRLYFALALVSADRNDEAEPHLRTLLTQEPQLKLDPKQHSPRAIAALESVRRSMVQEALPWNLDPGQLGATPLWTVPPASIFELSEPRVAPRPSSSEFLPWIADLGVIASFPASDVGDYGVGFGMRLALQRYFTDYFAANIAVSATNHAGNADSQGQSLWMVSVLGSGGVSVSVTSWARVEAFVTAGAVPVGLGSFGDDVALGIGGTAVARFRLAGAFGLSILTSVLWVRGEWPGTNGNALLLPTCLSASFSF